MTQKGVLEDLKVVDFGWVAADPQVTRQLSYHGATVIRVECHRALDTLRVCPPYRDQKPHVNGSGFFAAYNVNKYGISLDLTKPDAKEVTHRLVAWADVLTEGMTPGVLRGYGLDYESCRKINPGLIYLSTSTFGQKGPFKNAAGYGMYAAGYAGFSHILGWPDRGPLYTYNYLTDFFAPQFGAVAVLGALRRRRRSGSGTYIDLSQVESGLYGLGVSLMDYRANGRIAGRIGNHDPYMAPHGVYPCRGKDRYVAIAVTSEEEWETLKGTIAAPWCEEKKFSTLHLRKKNEDELDRHLAAWSAQYTAEQAMQLLVNAGIPAAVVETGEDLFQDPQLQARGHFQYLRHGEIGEHAYHSPAYRMTRTPHHFRKASPCLGEDNEYVYREILRYTDEEIGDLLVKGVITTDADLGVIRQVR
jgi:benzylsuccinate CoA-transferase BbsF subunit